MLQVTQTIIKRVSGFKIGLSRCEFSKFDLASRAGKLVVVLLLGPYIWTMLSEFTFTHIYIVMLFE